MTVQPTRAEAILPDTGRLRYEETDLSFLESSPVHFVCGIYLICVRGRCEVSTGAETFILSDETELIFLAGTLLQRVSATPDFKVRMLLIPREVYIRAMLPIDTPYLNYADEHPCYKHTQDVRSRLTWKQVCVWMDTAKMFFSGSYRSQYMDILEFDYLQAFLIWLLQLLREYAPKEHTAAFYAEKLCISPRYLHKATTMCLGGKSPKQLIEGQLLAETKVLLSNPSLTVTEIAEQLSFPDQSYLTRFFKRHTGMSPRQFRQRKG